MPKPSSLVPEPLLRFFHSHETFLIIGHQEPDADCIGSQLALGSILSRHGKTVHQYNHGPFKRPEINRYQPLFQPRIDAFVKVARPAVVILDCSTIDRIGDLKDDLGGLPVAMIDHHSAGADFGEVRWIDSSRPSATWLVYHLAMALGGELTLDEAHWLMLGLCTDTGFFRHLEAGSQDTFAVAAELAWAGASPKAVFAQIHGGKQLANQRLMGLVLSRTESYHSGEVLFSWEEHSDRDVMGAESRESDTIYQTLQGVSGCELIVILRQDTPTTCTGGLRSRSWIDVGALAQKFGGGGHVRASGFSCTGTLNEVKKRLLKELDAVFAARS